MVRTRGLELRHKNEAVLRDVNMEVRLGEIVGIIGRNGSGKSTLLRAMAGLHPASRGGVYYPSLEHQFSRHDRIMNKVHLVPQAPSAWPGTVETCARTFAALRGIGRARASVRRRATAMIEESIDADEVFLALEALDLWRFAAKTYSELSAGYRTRFELVKASLAEPNLLLLDEPLGPLDAPGRRRYLRTLRDFADSNDMGIVITAQDTSLLRDVADRVFVAEAGFLRPGHGVEGHGRSIFELTIHGSDDDIVAALSSVKELHLETDKLPYHVEIPRADAQVEVAQALARADLAIKYFRDLSDSPDWMLAILGR